MEVRKLISSTYIGFLVSISEVTHVGFIVPDEPVVSEHPNVSPKDLPRLPLESKMEFAIDLLQAQLFYPRHHIR